MSGNQVGPESTRALPARPSLEFERKRAKKLLAELRARDPNAQLAVAHFAIAREYGFASWPRLAQYFETLRRHELSAPPPAFYRPETFEQFAENVLARHRKRRPGGAQLFATFVPRFYGRSIAEVAEATVTLDDARLVVARENRLPSWEALMEFATSRESENPDWDWFESPLAQASRSIKATDLPSLQRIVHAHPNVLDAPDRLAAIPHDLIRDAVLAEWVAGTPDARRITDWLASQCARFQTTLNSMLASFVRMGHIILRDRDGVAFAEFLLGRGADPAWIAPNGLSVLEHLLLRGHHDRVVDLLASRTVPRKAFWIAAALGDVRALSGYFDRNNKLTGAARRHRPDFTAVGPFVEPSLPDADDLDIIWEAFYVAALNGRTASMDVLLARGFPVDHAPWGATMLALAIMRRMVPLVDVLLQRGATADITGAGSAQIDEWFYHSDPTNTDVRRIYELCGGKNADGIIRRFREKKSAPPAIAPRVSRIIDAAREEAGRLGQECVETHNLFIAYFRTDRQVPVGALIAGGVDISRFRQSIQHRLIPYDGTATPPDISLSAETQAALDTARAEAERRNRSHVTSFHLLQALAVDGGPIAQMLAPFGGSIEKMRETVATAV